MAYMTGERHKSQPLGRWSELSLSFGTEEYNVRDHESLGMDALFCEALVFCVRLCEPQRVAARTLR